MNLDRKKILDMVVRNAFLHHGKADVKAVLNKVMGAFPEARQDSKSAVQFIRSIIDEINTMGEEKFNALVSGEYPDLLVKEKKIQDHRLPDLKNVNGTVVMRLAPSPSGPLHLGHSRMAILNDEFVRRYGGNLILRIEDTNARNIEPAAYELIPEDLKWLGVNVTDTVIQSDRMDTYYREALSLIKAGHMYVCSCDPEEFRNLKAKSLACPHRNTDPGENITEFERIISDKEYGNNRTLVMKTDLKHPNPSVRDWIAFRTVDAIHPRQGEKYWFYPTMNFSVSVDDHLLGLTHVMRGKDHLNNTEKQKYLFDYNGWKKPEYYHFGLINIPDAILHATEMKEGIISGRFSGWDDVRLGTLLAMKRRGYLPETFRKYWIDSGMKEIDAEFSWDIFNSINRELVDPDAERLFFVPEPSYIELDFSDPVTAQIPKHPENSEMGFRSYSLKGKVRIALPKKDLEKIQDGEEFRLKDLCNLVKSGDNYTISVNDHSRRGLKILQWAPPGSSEFSVIMPDGTSVSGLIEPEAANYHGVSQFERFGYVNMFKGEKQGYYLHR